MRRLLTFVCAAVFVDAIFFAAITPLLPLYTEELGLTTTQAGSLVGSYAAGTLLAVLPSGWLAGRFGARATALAGLGLMSVASVVFAFGDTFAVLAGARFIQGVGGAASWSGALGWLVDAGPQDRRGQLIGTALGAALFGVVCGPVFGALAEAAGRELVFSAVGLAGAALIVLGLALPAPPVVRRSLAALLPAIRDPRVAGAMTLMLLPSIGFGAIHVLGPLDLAALGVGTGAIGLAFVLSAALEAVVNPLAGRVSDRRGRRVPIVFGLATGALAVVALTLPREAWLLFALIVISVPLISVAFTPAMALLSDGTAAHRIPQALGFAFANFGWAAGHAIGTAGSGWLADVAGQAVPYLALAATYSAAVIFLLRAGRPALALQAAGEGTSHGPEHS